MFEKQKQEALSMFYGKDGVSPRGSVIKSTALEERNPS